MSELGVEVLADTDGLFIREPMYVDNAPSANVARPVGKTRLQRVTDQSYRGGSLLFVASADSEPEVDLR